MPYPNDEAPGGDADPKVVTLDSERREEIQVALGAVREEHRVALVLRHTERLFYSKIAAVLEVPDGTAKGWESRGRAAMLVALTRESTGSRTTGDLEKEEHERGLGDRIERREETDGDRALTIQ